MRGKVLLLIAIAACGGGGGDTTPDAAVVPDATVAPDAVPPDAMPVTGGPIDPAILHDVAIVIAPGDLPGFDVDQTTRVPCDVTWDGTLVTQAGCRKKGSSGSHDPVTGKPSFSIKLDDTVPGQSLGGFDKLSLDNAIQDPTIQHEHVGYELWREADVPAHRTAFAQVSLDGEPKGIYVVVEPLDKHFLRDRYGVANSGGNLYEASSVDFAVTPDALDSKNGGYADLEVAAAAVSGTADADFVATVGALIDLDEYARYLAVEIALDAEDSYWLGRNNYYLYHRPDTDRFVMLPHGQDVWMGNPGLSPNYPPAGVLAVRMRGIPALSSAVDAELAVLAAPGGPLESQGARIDDALAVVSTTTRTDDFTVGDLATMTRGAAILKGQLAWRAARIRGDVVLGSCGDGVVQGAEQCDDGGTAPGDGCDGSCFPECITIDATWILCPAARDRATGAASCADAGATLAVPADPAEAATIASIVRRNLGSADAWIGVSDSALEDSWVDDLGMPAPYLGFSTGEPNGGTSENCAVLDTSTQGGWRDQSCGASYAAICRR